MGGPITQRTAFLTDAEKPYWPDTLPLAALLDMAARGEVIQTEGIANFMHADICWIEPEEYGVEFDRLCAQDALPEPAPAPAMTLEQVVAEVCGDGDILDYEPNSTLENCVVGTMAMLCVVGIIWAATH